MTKKRFVDYCNNLYHFDYLEPISISEYFHIKVEVANRTNMHASINTQTCEVISNVTGKDYIDLYNKIYEVILEKLNFGIEQCGRKYNAYCDLRDKIKKEL